jgi:TolB-like protein/tetratricopeptide (TPR) repeat protein
MLTGTWPFRGKTSVDVRHAVLHGTPKPLAGARPGRTPPRLQQILDRAMAKDPRDRYQRIAELRDELRSQLIESSTGAGNIGLTGSSAPPRHLGQGKSITRAVRWLRQLAHTESPITAVPQASTVTSQGVHLTPVTDLGVRNEKKTIAILPFKNFRNDPAFNFYEFSLADAVITELARLRSLVVRPSSLIAKYQGREIDPREAGREMNVDSVLAAGFLHAGERVRVTAQLLDVISGDILWSERIDADTNDLIALQDTIAQKIVEGLRVEVTQSEVEGLIEGATGNSKAYEEYLRGRDAFARFIFRSVSPLDCNAAIAHFERAIELDPKFALAFDGLGACHVNRVFKGLGDASDFAAAEANFNDALALDPEIVEARMLMVFVRLWHGEKLRAREEVEAMRRIAPDEAVVYFVKATIHRLDGEYERSLRSWEKLVQLDPAARTVARYNRALIFIFRGKFEDALSELDLVAADDPGNPLARAFRGLALYYQGLRALGGDVRSPAATTSPGAELIASAASLLTEVLSQHPSMHGIRPFLAMCLAAQGQDDAARAQLTPDVERNADVDADIAFSLGAALALLDENDQAFKWLSRSIEIGNGNRRLFEHDPNLITIRDDTRFKQLLEQINHAAGIKGERTGTVPKS